MIHLSVRANLSSPNIITEPGLAPNGARQTRFYIILLSSVPKCFCIFVHCLHLWFRLFHRHVPMWNHIVEPILNAWECGFATAKLHSGSAVPRISELCTEMNRGSWFLVLGLEDLKLVEPVEPNPTTLTVVGLIVFHYSWNQVEPCGTKFSSLAPLGARSPPFRKRIRAFLLLYDLGTGVSRLNLNLRRYYESIIFIIHIKIWR